MKLHFFEAINPLIIQLIMTEIIKNTLVYFGYSEEEVIIKETINVIIIVDNNPNDEEISKFIKFLTGPDNSFFLLNDFFGIENPLTFIKEYEGQIVFMLIIQHLYLF